MKTSILSVCLAFCAWTSVHAIVYRWPMGSASDMTSTFGPRHLAPSWFHAGLDLANLGHFMAPFNLRITVIERTLGNDNYIDFVPTESRSDAAYDVTHMRFRHISIPSDWVVGQTFNSGAIMSTLLAGPNHLDFKGWYYSQYNEKLTSHPLKWFAYDMNAERNTTLSITNGLQVDANGAHVKVTVTQPRNALSQNILEWAFGEYFSSGSNTTGDYMSVYSPDRFYVSYEKRINVNDEKLSGSTFTPFMYNGIKIEPASGVNPKSTVFKIYCKKTPKVVEFRLKDPKGIVFKTANDLNFASCVGCTPPAGAPRPPSSVTATQQANGVKVTWNLSPDHYGTQSTAYIVYRRPSSSGPLDAVPIGTVLGDNAQFIDSKYDQAEKRPNLSYQYSVAAINPRGEGCTGPLANQSCTPPAGKTCLEHCGAPLEKTMTMPGALSYYQPFHYGPTTPPSMANPSWWGFTLGNNFLIDPNERAQGGESYSPYSTYLYTTGPGSGSAVSQLITPVFTAANRNEAGLTFSWTMKFPDNLPTSLKALNLLAVSLLNSSDQFLYTMTYSPTGLYDPWSGYDIELSKNNTTGTTVLRQALTSTDTPGWKWIKFKMTIDKTTAAGGDGMIRVFYDIGNGWGFKEYIAYKDEQHTQFSKIYFAYLTGPQGGGSHCSVKFDNIKLEQGLNLAQSP